VAWNKSYPTSATKVKDADNYIRNNWQAFDDAIGREHKAMSNASSGTHTLSEAGVCLLSTYATISALTDLDGAIAFATDYWDFIINNGSGWQRARQIPANTIAFFGQDTAPSGWTMLTTLHDRVVVILTGGGATSGGTWEVSGYTTDEHKHDYLGIKSHYHSTTYYAAGMGSTKSIGTDNSFDDSSYTDYEGDASPETDIPIQATDVLSGDGIWRPAGVCWIVCQKD